MSLSHLSPQMVKTNGKAWRYEQKAHFEARLGRLPEKSSLVPFEPLQTPNVVQNVRKKLLIGFREKCVTN